MYTSESTSKDFVTFLHSSFPSAIPETAVESDLPTTSHALYPSITYTDPEEVDISQWLTTSARLALPDEDEAKHAERLGSLNIHLSTRTTLLGSKPSVADAALYYRLAPAVMGWSAEERTGEKGFHHIVRYIDFVQNASLFGLSIPADEKVKIDVNDVKFVHKPIDPKEEKERKKKEKAAAAAGVDGQTPLVVGRGKEKGQDTANSKEQPSEETAKAATSNDTTAQPSKKGKERKKSPNQPNSH
ncbi:hypothetical protein ABVK25_011135 [Lepraria finkii]|uniref:Nuclear-export cofactor Arc1-like N-terminal domain-containing protein n=1 Tax=Lepraria finkii TaxID=1340010 RepID=A0ABR4AR20_9LECA